MATASTTWVQKRLNHALHNESASALLTQTGGFDDWAVTTAFYAAVHFVEQKIFPMPRVGGSRKNPILGVEAYKSHRGKVEGCHTLRLDLVEQKLPAIAGSFQRLYEQSINARYYDYQMDPRDASDAQRKLRSIKTMCCAPKPQRPRKR